MRLPRDREKLLLEGKSMNRAEVFLNGKLMSRVSEVDDEENWVEVKKTSGGAVFSERKHGKVKITFPSNEA